jgi:uncharacterized membrane protein YciS (DUF1049 family)
MNFLLFLIVITANASFLQSFKIHSDFLIRSPKTTSQKISQKFHIKPSSQSSLSSYPINHQSSPPTSSDREIISSTLSSVVVTPSPSELLTSSNLSIIDFSNNEIKKEKENLSFLIFILIAFLIICICITFAFFCHLKIKNYIKMRFLKNETSQLQLAELKKKQEEEKVGTDNEIFSIDTHKPLTRSDAHLTTIDLD